MQQRTFLISDTHFSHHNIIVYENRPFRDIIEMDNHLISQWNSVVTENDLVLHLGDVSISGADRAREVLTQLNGRKLLIEGNHDSFSKSKWRNLGFEPVKRYFYNDYLLTHMPVDEAPLKVAVESGLLKGNIHGHTHSQNQHLDQDLYKCCCVELIDYTPILFNEFIKKTA